MTLAAGNGTALWYVTRASGVVALLLLTAGLVLGVVGTVRWRSALASGSPSSRSIAT